MLHERDARLDRRTFLRRTGAAGVVGGAAWLTGGCFGGDAASPGSGGSPASTGAKIKTLTVRTWGAYAGTLDPPDVPTYLEFQTISPVYEGLLAWKPGTFEPVNCLAESFTPSDDGLSFEFTLKEGIPFQGDYGEVTAADVKFSLERAAASELNRDGSRLVFDGVKVTGKYSGTISLKSPYAPYLTTSLPKWSAAIVSEKAVKERGDKFKTQPIMTGPYQVAEFNPQTGVTLQRFADYGGASKDYGTVAAFDEIVYKVIVEEQATQIAVNSGELTWSLLGLDSVEPVKANTELQMTNVQLPGQEMLGMNVQHPALKDINLRRAIRHAIDVPAIIAGAYSGLAPRQDALIGEGSLGYWEDRPVYDKDLDKAKEYFEAAGSPQDELELLAISNQTQRTAVQIIAEQLGEIGIKTSVRTADVPVVLNEMAENPPKPTTAMVYWVHAHGLDPAEWTQPWTGEKIGANNISFWKNDEYDALYSTGVEETDEDARANGYIEMQKIWDENVLGQFVAWPTHYYAGAKELKPVFNPMGFSLYHFFGQTA